MEENGITFADYIVNRVCPDNRFLEEMNRGNTLVKITRLVFETCKEKP